MGVLLVCFAWSVTEVVRYSYYAFNILGFVPYLLTWCRYSLFIILYPLGVAVSFQFCFTVLKKQN